MRPATAINVVHLYRRGPALDLILACGVIPGPPNTATGDWHTGHGLDELLQCLAFGLCCCATWLSPEVLGGCTPLVFDPADDEDV